MAWVAALNSARWALAVVAGFRTVWLVEAVLVASQQVVVQAHSNQVLLRSLLQTSPVWAVNNRRRNRQLQQEQVALHSVELVNSEELVAVVASVVAAG